MNNDFKLIIFHPGRRGVTIRGHVYPTGFVEWTVVRPTKRHCSLYQRDTLEKAYALAMKPLVFK